MYKQSKWAKEILALQKEDGSWGYFHTLSEPKKTPITTEQALRRLINLDYTLEDEPINRAFGYISRCLEGKQTIPDRREKLHDWDIFTDLMFAVWLRTFTTNHQKANQIAGVWGQVIAGAFKQGSYHHQNYIDAYEKAFGKKPRGGRLVDFVSFYQVSLLAGQLDAQLENQVLAYILNHQQGLYYIYGGASLAVLPSAFATKKSSRYLGAITLLTRYSHSREQLAFVGAWLKENQNNRGMWDMGPGVKDHIYFPLSDSWGKAQQREKDCTYRVQKLLKLIG